MTRTRTRRNRAASPPVSASTIDPTGSSPMTEAKRQSLKQKVATGRARQEKRKQPETTTTVVDRAGERAIETKDKLFAFAKEHPIATVAGGLAVGILISGLFKRSPTRQVASKAATRASALAAI